MNNPWNINPDEYNKARTMKDRLEFWLRYASLAPSAHNTQPWECEIEGEGLRIERSSSRTLGTDQTTRLAHLGLGAFIENLTLASENCGYTASVTLTTTSPENYEVASVKFIKQQVTGNDTSEMVDAITIRHTNRGHYRKERCDDRLLEEVLKGTEGPAKSFPFSSDTDKSFIADLVSAGTEIALSLPVMKRELADYVYSLKKPKDIGMPLESMIDGVLGQIIGPSQAIKLINPTKLALVNKEKYANSPLIVVIGVTEDDPEAWVQAGRLMQRLLLKATACGYAHDIAAAPTEVPTLLPKLRTKLPDGYRPIIVFRVGKPSKPSLSISSGRRQVQI